MNDPCIDAMRVALRVLSALLDGHPPNQSDIESLRKFAPLLEEGPTDEMACDVIQQAMKRRAQLRRAGRDGY